ncbi:hypothetical protein [Halosimplex pelagicum]|uniref:Uncharacterized protein n=1 Tax=Halosimplex pelagicum TaxID=869886 RepID=A0A7D5T8W8_9EURY|nr:hypothetical protein [Halosimplex pelagicum]QLH81370.1 hypothetical protein HZS54_06905 [Halosimplex pelagicum]
MADRASRAHFVVAVTVPLWIDGLVLGYLFELATLVELLWACWAASLLLLPAVIIDSPQSGGDSWPTLGGLCLPVLNLVTGAIYAFDQFRTRHGEAGQDNHGLISFIAVSASVLSVVIAPYVFGFLALGAGFWVRQQYSSREGALLLTTAGTTMLFGLTLNVVVFLFLRPGPVL